MKGLSQRVVTGILFVITVVAAIWGGIYFFVPLVILFTILCSRELLKITIPKDDISDYKRILGIGLSLIPIAYILVKGTSFEIDALDPLTLLGISMVVVFSVELFGSSKRPFDSAASIILSIIYIGVPFALLIAIPQTLGAYDPVLLFAIFLFTWANDTGAYFVGSLIGKHKLFERISPKKTIEGAVGGLVICILIAVILSRFSQSLNVTEFIFLSIIVSITSTIGDLVESMLKRSREIKDSGQGLPGHGGFLDRFDGFIFALPFAYLYLTAVN